MTVVPVMVPGVEPIRMRGVPFALRTVTEVVPPGEIGLVAVMTCGHGELYVNCSTD